MTESYKATLIDEMVGDMEIAFEDGFYKLEGNVTKAEMEEALERSVAWMKDFIERHTTK